MAQPEVASNPETFQRLAKEASSLESVVNSYDSYKSTLSAIEDTNALLKESSDDPEMAEMAEEELEELQKTQQVSISGFISNAAVFPPYITSKSECSKKVYVDTLNLVC